MQYNVPVSNKSHWICNELVLPSSASVLTAGHFGMKLSLRSEKMLIFYSVIVSEMSEGELPM